MHAKSIYQQKKWLSMFKRLIIQQMDQNWYHVFDSEDPTNQTSKSTMLKNLTHTETKSSQFKTEPIRAET